jgi:4-aminobutyrate aminotransferase-like enzyme
MVMAKTIGNGFPLAAVVTTEEVAAPWAKKLHFNTYGGNPMASSVGLAVLETIENDNLHENCEVVGTRLINGFKGMQEKYNFKSNGAPVIGDVRGRGMMLGVELWNQDGSMASAEVMSIVDGMKKRGCLVGHQVFLMAQRGLFRGRFF